MCFSLLVVDVGYFVDSIGDRWWVCVRFGLVGGDLLFGVCGFAVGGWVCCFGMLCLFGVGGCLGWFDSCVVSVLCVWLV